MGAAHVHDNEQGLRLQPPTNISVVWPLVPEQQTEHAPVSHYDRSAWTELTALAALHIDLTHVSGNHPTGLASCVPHLGHFVCALLENPSITLSRKCPRKFGKFPSHGPRTQLSDSTADIELTLS